MDNKANTTFLQHLNYLKLPGISEHYETLLVKAMADNWTHFDLLSQIIELEATLRQERAIARKIKAARFPVMKSLEQFRFTWPEQINELQVKDLFRLQFLKQNQNIIFMGTVGLGKSHLATALGHQACLQGSTVLFTNAIDAINDLVVAKKAGKLKHQLKKYLKPGLLILDELGYLPIDKTGADLLFQIISGRYEQGATIITTNRAYKDWPEIFNNDSTLTSALLDRLIHHAQTVIIEGKSYRMKEKLEP
ncbi:MAG: ATP-binding protein [Gammaproteobacteria bacterium]|nr:ATP-binding protein [Gammaproteobacteria bacterium]